MLLLAFYVAVIKIWVSCKYC